MLIPNLDLETLMKAAQPTSPPRGGKYLHREWAGERWRYYYNDDKSPAHGFTAVGNINDTTFAHSLSSVAENLSGDPEKDYKSALEKLIANPNVKHPVANPQGGDDLILSTIVSKSGTRILRMSDKSGSKIKDFSSRGAYELWYLGTSNTTQFLDHTGMPMFEVRPKVGRVVDGEFVPNTTKTVKKLASGVEKEYAANKWWVEYCKDYPAEKRLGKVEKWQKSSRQNAEIFVRKLIRDQELSAGVPQKNFELSKDETIAVDGAKKDTAHASPGSVADKIQSGAFKWRINKETGKRELDLDQSKKDALIAQTTKEYYKVVMSLANQMASNELFTKDNRTSMYGSTGKWGWIERFLGSDAVERSTPPDFIFPSPESPTYKAANHALNTFDPAMGVGFTGYFAGKQGILYWKMRLSQDEFINEIKTESDTSRSKEGEEYQSELSATDEQRETSAHLQTTENLSEDSDVETWTQSIKNLIDKWEESAPDYQKDKREKIKEVLASFLQLKPIDQPKYMPHVNEILTELVDWRSILGKALELSAMDLLKADMALLTRDKKVAPDHEYSHMEGEKDSNPKYYYKDPVGNVIRYSNAPTGHSDRSQQYGEAAPHFTEPQFDSNPEYFTPDGRKLSRCPDCDPNAVEWNSNYSQYDPQNLWVGRWIDPITGKQQYTYLDADLRNFPRLRIHQQNAITDVRLPALREYATSLFVSDRLKDQLTALALVLLDQGRMRVVELATLTPAHIVFEGSIVNLGNRKIYADNTLRSALEILKLKKNPDEPLFAVPLQKQDGSIDTSLQRLIGPNYLSSVLDQLGIPLLGLQTYHATMCFTRKLQRLVSQYAVPWDQAVQQALLASALEWGHDFSQEVSAPMILQLTQSVLIDPVVVDALKRSANEQGLLYNIQTQELPASSIPIPYVSLEMTGKTSEEIEFSKWLHSTPIHEYA